MIKVIKSNKSLGIESQYNVSIRLSYYYIILPIITASRMRSSKAPFYYKKFWLKDMYMHIMISKEQSKEDCLTKFQNMIERSSIIRP